MPKTLKTNDSKVSRYEALIEFGQLTSSSLDYTNIQKKAETKIKKLLDCESVVIYRLNYRTNQLEHNYKQDKKSEVISYEVDEFSFVGSCAKYASSLLVKDVKSDLRYNKSCKQFQDLKPKELLLVPLLQKGEILGVIEAVNSLHKGFNEEDIHFAEAIANQLTMALENANLFEKLQNQFIQVVESLADAIGKKDSYTGGHTKRVRHFAEMIGKELDLSVEDMGNLRLAAVLHDIGKIGIEDKILKKSAPLTSDEFSIMKEHPRLGFEILGHIESLKPVIDGMRFHHERPDGKGYPFGLKGDEIPLLAMIISVADTFDAMISTRPYRKGLAPMLAWEEIMKNSGTQFSENVAQAFDRAFKKTKMYRPKKLKAAG